MDDNQDVVALGQKAETYARAEILLQEPTRELTRAEASLLRAGIYCGIAAVYDELAERGPQEDEEDGDRWR